MTDRARKSTGNRYLPIVSALCSDRINGTNELVTARPSLTRLSLLRAATAWLNQILHDGRTSARTLRAQSALRPCMPPLVTWRRDGANTALTRVGRSLRAAAAIRNGRERLGTGRASSAASRSGQSLHMSPLERVNTALERARTTRDEASIDRVRHAVGRCGSGGRRHRGVGFARPRAAALRPHAAHGTAHAKCAAVGSMSNLEGFVGLPSGLGASAR